MESSFAGRYIAVFYAKGIGRLVEDQLRRCGLGRHLVLLIAWRCALSDAVSSDGWRFMSECV